MFPVGTGRITNQTSVIVIPLKLLDAKITRNGPKEAKRALRVWKGIFGIRDLTKIRCGNRENDKYIDGIRDLTVSREPGLAKNSARDAGFMFVCLSGMAETVTTHRF